MSDRPDWIARHEAVTKARAEVRETVDRIIEMMVKELAPLQMHKIERACSMLRQAITDIEKSCKIQPIEGDKP